MIGIITLTDAGGTIDLNDYAPATRFLITTAAPVTLLANWVIQNTVPAATTSYEFILDANVDLNSNTVTILGQSVEQDLLNKPSLISSYYDGSTYSNKAVVDYSQVDWVTTVKILNGAVTEDKIGANAVTAVKILDGVINAAKLDAAGKIEIVIMPLSWETGEQGAGYRIYCPYACVLLGASITVSKDIAATDDATAPVTTSAGTPTPSSVISFAAGTTAGTTQLYTFSGAPATVLADGYILFTPAKVTAGGKAIATVWIQRS